MTRLLWTTNMTLAMVLGPHAGDQDENDKDSGQHHVFVKAPYGEGWSLPRICERQRRWSAPYGEVDDNEQCLIAAQCKMLGGVR